MGQASAVCSHATSLSTFDRMPDGPAIDEETRQARACNRLTGLADKECQTDQSGGLPGPRWGVLIAAGLGVLGKVRRSGKMLFSKDWKSQLANRRARQLEGCWWPIAGRVAGPSGLS